MLTALTIGFFLHCSSWTNYQDAQAVCLVNNAWTQKGNLAENIPPCTDAQPRIITHAQLLTNATNTELYAMLDMCGNGPERAFKLRKWQAQHWIDIAEQRADDPPDYAYAQFGIDAKFISFLQNPISMVINNGSSTVLESLQPDNTWLKNRFVETAVPLTRHPQLYQFGSRAFILYGEPRVSLYEVFDDDVQVMPEIPNIDTELTLYTDMTMWNGMPVVAYTYWNRNTTAWPQTIDKTRIILLQNGIWTTLTEGIQDTWSHDGVKPHLFVINGKLHAMYFDYSSTGRPSDAQVVRGRFRVKTFDPATMAWTRVGNESPIFMLSQKFEYFDEGDTVYFNAVVRSLPYYLQQSWKWNQNFVRFGPNIRVMNQGMARPSNVVTYVGP